MNTFAIPALKEKRASIAGRVISLKKQIARHHKELANLDATIALFEPSYRIGSIKPKRPHKRSKLFKLGELGRLCIDALRRANGVPQSTRKSVRMNCVSLWRSFVQPSVHFIKPLKSMLWNPKHSADCKRLIVSCFGWG